MQKFHSCPTQPNKRQSFNDSSTWISRNECEPLIHCQIKCIRIRCSVSKEKFSDVSRWILNDIDSWLINFVGNHSIRWHTYICVGVTSIKISSVGAIASWCATECVAVQYSIDGYLRNCCLHFYCLPSESLSGFAFFCFLSRLLRYGQLLEFPVPVSFSLLR